MTDFNTWLLDVGYDRIFRVWKYKRMFTPYEQKEAFSDESIYEDDICDYVKIREAIELPDGDILLGLQTIEDSKDLDNEDSYLSYYRLSQIELTYSPDDQKIEEWE